MSCTRTLKALAIVAGLLLMTGCATRQPYDYTAFKESKPRSIVVMPPLNNTPEVQASYSVLSYATLPLAESGYYVMPVTLVAETFKENGMTQPADMHATPAAPPPTPAPPSRFLGPMRRCTSPSANTVRCTG